MKNITLSLLASLALGACSSNRLSAPVCPASGERPANVEGLAPVVWDDARFTYLKFQGHQSIPNVSALGEKGAERSVNFNFNPDSETLTVHGVYPVIVLRNGSQVACIRNNVFDRIGRGE